jgi:glutamine synthetase
MAITKEDIRQQIVNDLETNSIVRKSLGEHVYEDFIRFGRAEWDAYRISVHDWEIKHYLNLILA